MYYKIVFFVILLSTACTETRGIKMNKQLLTIKAICNQDKTCYFEGEDLLFTIEIRNNHHKEIGFPLDFNKKIGPSIRLINKSKNKETDVPTMPANFDLENKLVFIKPKGIEKIESVIPAGLIKDIFEDSIEIFAEINLFSEITIEKKGRAKKIDFSEVDTMHIILGEK